MSTDLFHQFRQFLSATTLWDALEQRYEGNDQLKVKKKKALKREFDNFNAIANESLDDLIARFYHLMSEMHANGMVTTMAEKVECMTDALPSTWDSFLMVMTKQGKLATININDFCSK